MRILTAIERTSGITLNLLLALTAILALLDLPGIIPSITQEPLFGWTTREVLTASMEPTYHVGSLIYFHVTDPQDVAVNDVIAFESADGSVTAHRVTSIDAVAQTFTTKGDANSSEDPVPVPYASYLGTAKASIPLLGGLLGTVQEKPLVSAAITLSIGSAAYMAGLLARTAKTKRFVKEQDWRRK